MKKILLIITIVSLSISNAQVATQKSDSEINASFINILNNTESYSIKYNSQGCFHNESVTLTIKRDNNKFYIIYNDTKRLLSDSEVKRIQKFETELQSVKDMGCTTVDTYVLEYRDKRIETSDGGCEWNGFYNLKKELNL